MTTRTTFIRPHDPEDPAAATKAAAIALIAAEYRDRHPLPLALDGQEKNQIKENTIRFSIYGIDTTIPLHNQRTQLDGYQYVELAILGGEAFLVISERIGAPKALRHFVRRHQLHDLRQLKKLTVTELNTHSFVKAMKNNTGWVDGLLELVRLLKPVKGFPKA
ncbi:hypothetical protein CEP52_017858 [Fusarium oligoseptatum]|uniref:Uncharacterized protein n=1 Tax=Fusarium oligoseptatum TaxID=2604345 RepID=A0A428RCU6_9HYPO|nr:hypothetical protein CEP52_017858 [Fusarium oligoseptatum]